MVKSILITGATGYLGHFLLRSFCHSGILCYVLIRNSPVTSFNHENIIPIYSLDPSRFLLSQISVDVVLHLGGPSSHQCDINYESLLRNSLSQASELVHFITKLNITRFFFFSSIHIYGASDDQYITEQSGLIPTSNYGFLKYELEHYFAKAFSNTCCLFTSLRLSNIIAPPYHGFQNWNLVFHSFLHSCVKNDQLTIKSNPLICRDFVSIEFFLYYIHALLNSTSNPTCLNLTSGVPLSLIDLALLFQHRSAAHLKVPNQPIRIITLTPPTPTSCTFYNNNLLTNLFGKVSNNIQLQIDLSFEYFASL